MLGRRKLKNLLLYPESQVRFGLIFLTFATFTHVALTIVAIKIYSGWLIDTDDPSRFPAWIPLIGLVLVYFALQAFAFSLGLYISHRLLGPIVPIRKFIEDLKNGRPAQPLNLRKSDDPQLRELASDLNSLAQLITKK